MGAYNWILVEATCPACREPSVVRCQTHVASDFRGDHRGRFNDREYVLGQPMAWFPRESVEWPSWQIGGRSGIVEAEYEEEACYSDCARCGAALYVVIRFHELVPERVLDIGLEAHWPDGYMR